MHQPSRCCSYKGSTSSPCLQAYYQAGGWEGLRCPRRQRRSSHSSASPVHARRAMVVRCESPQQSGGNPSTQDRVINNLVASGLAGSVAVMGAGVANIDLFGQFNWSSPSDLLQALSLACPLLLLEALLLGPRWDRLLAGGRDGDRQEDQQQQHQGNRSSSRRRRGVAGLALRTDDVDRLLSYDSFAATLVLHQACLVGAEMVRARGSRAAAEAEVAAAEEQAGAGTTTPSSSPSSQPHPRHWQSLLADVSLLLLRDTSRELLLRGLGFTLAAAWLADRAFEAGAEDLIRLSLPLPPLPTAALPFLPTPSVSASLWSQDVYLTDAVRYSVAALLTGLMLPYTVLTEARALSVGVGSNLALVRVRVQREREEEERRRRGTGAAGGSTEQVAGGEGGDGEAEEDEAEAMVWEFRLLEALERSTASGPSRLTYALTLLRGLLRFGCVNLVFAVTGNLAASWLATTLPGVLLYCYVRAGPKVLLEGGVGKNGTGSQPK
ncbi:hypothetical protein Agub_g14409 [Astrephomene gubernaculifera]|uniref:Uncharacterized protein n=1 Tax=Astrephomene gubernaculifera TaxID=47775 RepID=A0AAD3E3H3_9CHLO|nr:hypothetical protein Agub_g14409 [Astrephomene gubernaculifera]